jgi:hypothetical protein
MKNYNKFKLLAGSIVLAGWALSGCGQLDKAVKKAKGEEDSASQTSDTPPGPTEPVTVDQNVDQWADDSISALSLPANDRSAVAPYESCTAYYNGFMGYAKAIQAMYIKRFLAWGRYQLAVGALPYRPVIVNDGYIDYPNGSAKSGSNDMPDASDMGAPTGTAESADNAVSASNGAQQPATAPQTTNVNKDEYTTNNQEQGVDETDYVKSNGRFIFIAHGNLLRVIDLKGDNVFAAQIVGESPRGLHLAGNKLVLITQSSVPVAVTNQVTGLPVSDAAYWWGYYDYYRRSIWHYQQVTNVREFTVQDNGTLIAGKERKYYGNFREGREIGGELHLVMQKNLPWNILLTGLNFNMQPLYWLVRSEAELVAYAQKVAEQNLNTLRVLMFEDSALMADHQSAYKAGQCAAMPKITSFSADAVNGQDLIRIYREWDARIVYRQGMPVNVYQQYPVFPTYDHVTQVATISMNSEKADRHGFAISPVSAQTIYASSNKILVGSNRYEWRRFWQQIYVLPAVVNQPAACIGSAELCAQLGMAPGTGVVTVGTIPALTLTQTTNYFDFLTYSLSPDGARPEAIGSVPGTPVNSYAIDAGASTFRMVVTANQQQAIAPVGGIVQVKGVGYSDDVYSDVYYPRNTNVTQMHVVQQNGSEFKIVSTLPLQVNGSVSGVRFFTNSAFISTSDAASPLYAVDLRDEMAPKLAGAMPDFMRASYFHPMGDGKTILAIGRLDAAYVAAKVADCAPAVVNCEQLIVPVRANGVSVAMIDVENIAAPKLLARTSLQYGNSNAEYDFKSFRFIPRLGMLVLPVTYPFRVEMLVANRDKGFAHFGQVTLQDQFTSRFGMGGAPRTMLFDDLLVGVFGNQDFGAALNYATRAPQLVFSQNLGLIYQNIKVGMFPYYWKLENAHEIKPVWRSATLLH